MSRCCCSKQPREPHASRACELARAGRGLRLWRASCSRVFCKREAFWRWGAVIEHVWLCDRILLLLLYPKHSMGLPYICLHWGGFGGQCRHIRHTWSVWVCVISQGSTSHNRPSESDWGLWRFRAFGQSPRQEHFEMIKLLYSDPHHIST